jgi:uroporphyrinogen decarboxylase
MKQNSSKLNKSDHQIKLAQPRLGWSFLPVTSPTANMILMAGSSMKPRDMILEAVHHRQPPCVPYTLAMEEEVEQRVNEYYGGAHWKDRLLRFTTGVSAVDTDRKDVLDENHYRDGYGGIWRSDRLPWHLETPPLRQPSFDGYTFPSPEDFYRPDWKEQAWATCAENQDYFRIGHLGWGLFERSWNLRGFETVLMDAVDHPDFFEEMLDRLTDLYLSFVDYTCELPVDGILFGDDWGDQRGVIIGPKRWRKFIKPRWAKIYQRVHEHGKIVMHHSCGSVADIMPDIIEIGMDVLESVQPEAAGMNPYELKKKWGDKITFWGCLGSQSTIPFGKPTEIRQEVRRLKSEVGAGGGFILAPAKPLRPETPTENAVALVEAFLED